MKRFLVLLALLLPGLAWAQVTFPSNTTVANSTISVTNTFQTLLAANSDRKGCLMQNQGTHTMYVADGGSLSTAASLQVSPGQTFSCLAPGIRITDILSITGTAGDAYVVWSQ
jgi:hypothetical protein